jgi:hypothetical protein
LQHVLWSALVHGSLAQSVAVAELSGTVPGAQVIVEHVALSSIK